jgi:hypothetical protein
MEYKFAEQNEETIYIEHPDLRRGFGSSEMGGGFRSLLEDRPRGREEEDRRLPGWTLRWSGREGIHRFDWPHYTRTEENLHARAQMVFDRALAEH